MKRPYKEILDKLIKIRHAMQNNGYTFIEAFNAIVEELHLRVYTLSFIADHLPRGRYAVLDYLNNCGPTNRNALLNSCINDLETRILFNQP